jgi:AraC family transcriptional regulator
MVSTQLFRLHLPAFTVRESVYPAGGRLLRHAHGHTSVTAILSGDIEETTDSGQYRARSCSVLIKPAGTLHANHVLGRTATRTISIEMDPRPAFRVWGWREDPAAALAALRLQQALRGTKSEEIEVAAHALVDAVTPRAAPDAPAWLATVLQILSDRFDRSIRFEEIAREVGLHPVYLARAFRRHTGSSMGDHVRGLRLGQARHLLSGTNRSIGAIAADAGFSDPSHLSRLFAEAHAMTPRAFRRVVQSVPFPAPRCSYSGVEDLQHEATAALPASRRAAGHGGGCRI